MKPLRASFDGVLQFPAFFEFLMEQGCTAGCRARAEKHRSTGRLANREVQAICCYIDSPDRMFFCPPDAVDFRSGEDEIGVGSSCSPATNSIIPENKRRGVQKLNSGASSNGF